jgi:hypothetical protein
MCIMDSGKFRRMSVVILGSMLADWPAGTTGQEGSPPVAVVKQSGLSRTLDDKAPILTDEL